MQQHVLHLDFIEKNKINRNQTVRYTITQNGCWECVSHKKDKYGYCNISINGKKYKIHKLVLEQKLHRELKPFPEEVTRHKCDNACCINPEHLEEGSSRDNANDKVLRGRSGKGEENSMVKITENDVHKIRRMLQNEDYTIVEIAKLTGLNSGIVSKIKNLHTWSHLHTEGVNLDYIKNKNTASSKKVNGNAKLTIQDVKEIKRLLAQGNLNEYEIANKYNVSYPTINKIKLNRSWQHVIHI